MSQIRASALGSDTLEDRAIDAADWPMWLGQGYPPLPDPVGSEIQAYSDSAISKVVPKFRDAVRSFTATTGNQERSDMLSEYLTWDELIHTSYFYNTKFCKLIAYALIQTEGFRATEAFRNDPDFEAVADWYSDLTHSTPSPEMA